MEQKAERKVPLLGTPEAAQLKEDTIKRFKDGVDYGVIEGLSKKASLFKPGSEKMMGAFNLDAHFESDKEVMSMMSDIKALVAFKCVLFQRETGIRFGEGRGAAQLGVRGSRDVNSAIKMAQKSAQIDAVIRAFELSDRFTQDLEDIKAREGSVDKKTSTIKVVGGHIEI